MSEDKHTSTDPHGENPFDDVRDLIAKIPHPEPQFSQELEVKFASLSGRPHPLGSLQERLAWLANWQATAQPKIERPLIAVFAASHDVARELGADDIVGTALARVKNTTEGSAGVRGIAQNIGAAFKVYELGVEYPCANMTKEPSLSAAECAAAMAFGMEVVAEGADIIALGSTGFGSATAAAGVARALYGGTTEFWARGKGKYSDMRIEAVAKAAELHRDIIGDPLEVLRCYGGRDIAGMVGAILAARIQSIPVVLDGFVTCAAAAILHKSDPLAISHCLAGHLTQEPAHGALLDRLGLTPLHSMQIGIGDGTGAAMALSTLKSATEAINTLFSA